MNLSPTTYTDLMHKENVLDSEPHTQRELEMYEQGLSDAIKACENVNSRLSISFKAIEMCIDSVNKLRPATATSVAAKDADMQPHMDFDLTKRTGREFVMATIKEIEAYPANCNPFHYDLGRMGSDLVRGWMVMHDGYDNKEDPRALDTMILVNTRSGQRLFVDLSHVALVQPVTKV